MNRPSIHSAGGSWGGALGVIFDLGIQSPSRAAEDRALVSICRPNPVYITADVPIQRVAPPHTNDKNEAYDRRAIFYEVVLDSWTVGMRETTIQ